MSPDSVLLAAALTALVLAGRRRQHAEHKRRAGAPVPTEPATSTERELRSIAEPVGARVLDSAGVGPLVRVLGPVSVEGARGSVDRSHVGQLTEIAAYIALHPGTTSQDLDNAIWPGEPHKTASRAQACSRLRNWLGSDQTGQRYFPQMADGHYRFTPAVRTDWDQFQALVPTDPATVPTEQLETALALVRGQPFTGATGRRPKYRWADRLKSHMITTITDTSIIVAERALNANQPAQARTAATTGLQAEPGTEQLWRLLLQAEHQAGNRHGIHTAIDRLEHQLHDLGTDPEPETTQLIEQLLRTRRRNLAV